MWILGLKGLRMFQFLPAITKLYRKLVQNPIPKTIPYMWYSNIVQCNTEHILHANPNVLPIGWLTDNEISLFFHQCDIFSVVYFQACCQKSEKKCLVHNRT